MKTLYKKGSLCFSMFLILVVAVLGSTQAVAAGSPASFSHRVLDLSNVNFREMPRIDNQSLIAETERLEAGQIDIPYQFAHRFNVDIDITHSATREILADGSTLWRLRIISNEAEHINLGFSRFNLPEGAKLWIYNTAGDHIAGPYLNTNRSGKGRFFTPIIRGDEIVIEIHAPEIAEGPLVLTVGAVNHGFRGFTDPSQGFCNNDVICPEGDPWRDQISSVARFTRSGFILCSGQLLNNTTLDRTPYFLSADHCGVDVANADTVVVYWNYESPVCGQLSGGSLDQNQSGASFVSSFAPGDMNLIELDQAPLPTFNIDYAGWNVSDDTPQSSFSIHHPSGDEKAISFDNDPLTTVDIGYGGLTHWEVGNWEDGTTEPGSSGSCIFDTSDGLCVGVLTGGFASCANIAADFYGKLSVAWEGGGTPETRLRDWLDPLNSGATSLPGLNQLSRINRIVPAVGDLGLILMMVLFGLVSVYYLRKLS